MSPADVEILCSRGFRIDNGLTQQAVARAMGTTQPYIARLEAGEVDPRVSTLRRYQRAVSDVMVRKLKRLAAGKKAVGK